MKDIGLLLNYRLFQDVKESNLIFNPPKAGALHSKLPREVHQISRIVKEFIDSRLTNPTVRAVM